MKKPVKRKSAPARPKRTRVLKRKKTVSPSISYSRYLVISVSVLLLLFVGSLKVQTSDKPFVLGTSVLMARGEGDPGNTEKPIDASNSAYSEKKAPPKNVDAEKLKTIVDCVGPDGKHFQTSYKDCAGLNNGWGKKNFSFTELKKDAQITQKPEKPLPPDGKPTSEGKMEYGTKIDPEMQGNQKIRLEKERDHVILKKENADGTEEKIDEQDQTLKELNLELDKVGVEVAAEDNHNISFRKNGVKANSLFPLTVDPATKELKVTTPAGIKTVSVLPNQAVENILQRRLLNSVEKESASGSASADTTTTLTQLNNQPVFKVNGFANKKALGFIPVSFAKTVYVSAETGEIVKTNQDFFSKLIETISF